MMRALIDFWLFSEVATFILSVFTEKVPGDWVAAFHLNGLEAMVIVTVGNMVPIFLILALAEKFHVWISKTPVFASFGPKLLCTLSRILPNTRNMNCGACLFL